MLGVRRQDEGSFASEASPVCWGLQMCLHVCRQIVFVFHHFSGENYLSECFSSLAPNERR